MNDVSADGFSWYRCGFCGGTFGIDKTSFRTAHSMPMCKEYEALCQQAKLEGFGELPEKSIPGNSEGKVV